MCKVSVRHVGSTQYPLPRPGTSSAILDIHRTDWVSPGEFCHMQFFPCLDDKVDVKPFLEEASGSTL